MGLRSQIDNAITKELDRVSRQIEGELKAACPQGATGQAKASIHIEEQGEFARFVGGTHLHLYFADEGNNQRMRTIYPVRAKALKFTDGSFHANASTYEGKHFVREVANKHR